MDRYEIDRNETEPDFVQKKQEVQKKQSDDAEFRSVMPVMAFILIGIGLAFFSFQDCDDLRDSVSLGNMN